jgi:penicillin-binding protein 1A
MSETAPSAAEDDPRSESEPLAPSAAAPPRRWLVWLKRLVTLFFAMIGIGCIALTGLLKQYERNLPSTAELKNYDPPQVTRILARDGTVLGELFLERRTLVPIDAIPKSLKLAVLAAEDAEFYRHEGLDYLGMLRALIVNLRHAEARQGGSTITQQVVKNVLLSSEKTFDRKVRELLLARRIEQELSKDEILELYLNHINFGHGRYGVEEASRYYFGKSVGKITLAEAAMLAALPKGPAIYSPRVDLERAKRRRDLVLEQMVAKDFAERELVELAKAEPIVLAPAVDRMSELAPEVVDEVQRVLKKHVGPNALRGGYTVTTSIDPQLQAAARAAARKNLDAYAQRHGLLAPLRAKKKPDSPFAGTPKPQGHHVYNAVVTGADDARGLLTLQVGTAGGNARVASRYDPKSLPPSQFAPKGTVVRVSAALEHGLGDDGMPREYRLELAPESAIVLIDVATREIVALVGSYEGVRGGLDRATFAKRQPGSTFKPFVYGYGIHARRMTPATVVPLPDALNPNKPVPVSASSASSVPPAEPPPAAPPASDAPPELKKPPVFLRDALAKSINEAAVWTLNELGPPSVVAFASSMGVRSAMQPTESLALGAYETTPRDLAGAYLTLASAGSYAEPVLIRKIVARDGNEVALPAAAPPRQVLEESEAYLVTSLLTSVIDRGTARAARGTGIPLAGKTGTSNDAKDAWFAGYSPEYVCVVWTGYDDAVPLGPGEQGATAALPAFVELMKAAHRGKKVAPWREPSGLVRKRIDPMTGLLAFEGQQGAFEELFLTGTQPTEVAAPPADGSPEGNKSDSQHVVPSSTPPAAASDTPPPF